MSFTDKATHVYVKVDEPRGLNARFEGPYKIVSRPSRSQIEVRIGSYADGSERRATFHWSACKIAHMRESATEGSRPMLGRRPSPSSPEATLTENKTNSNSTAEDARPVTPSPFSQTVIASDVPAEPSLSTRADTPKQNEGAKIQNEYFETIGGRRPHPDYLAKGPVITRDMFNKWTPDMLGSSSSSSSSRPVRKTRNPNPNYVDAMSVP